MVTVGDVFFIVWFNFRKRVTAAPFVSGNSRRLRLRTHLRKWNCVTKRFYIYGKN